MMTACTAIVRKFSSSPSVEGEDVNWFVLTSSVFMEMYKTTRNENLKQSKTHTLQFVSVAVGTTVPYEF